MNKLKETNGKYYQECEVVMLATNEKAAIVQESFLGNKRLILGRTLNIGDIGYHLYFTSNEVIKEGDWCHNSKRKSIELGKYMIGTNEFIFCKKIVATTDISLQLPQPSKSFIQAYIKTYNEAREQAILKAIESIK